jgi:diguanylate cyclase (GGDEF)-like protein
MEFTLRDPLVLNGRWLFDTVSERLVDLDGHKADFTLTPLCARLLGLFAASPQAVLRRRQLFELGWKAFGFEVCENSLNQVISALRATFETIDPGRPYFKTLPRIGYCFLAEVRPATPADCPPRLPGRSADARQPDARHILRAHSGEPSAQQAVAGDWQHAQQDSLPLSLLVIAVDQLAEINACDGRNAGNEALAMIEKSIVQQLHRPGDCVTRAHGATFVVRLADTDVAGACQVAHRIRAAVQDCGRNGADGGVPDELTMSIGIGCTAPARFESASAFIAATYAALDAAKRAGGDQIAIDSAASSDHTGTPQLEALTA